MGNRANVVFVHGKDIAPVVYLHWNGGPESVYAFVAELELRKGFDGGPEAAAARFAGVVADFFGDDDGHSLYLYNAPRAITAKQLERFDHSDNGTYVVTRKDGETTFRRFVENRSGVGLRELSEDAVATEKLFAEHERQYAGILEDLRKIREARKAVAG